MSAAPPAAPAVNLDQASNGGIGKTPVNPVGWENGNQNGQKAHYHEGESIPYRARVTGLTSGTTYRVTFGYDITHGGGHAIDYITGRQRIAETVNPCQNATTVDITPCVAGASNSSGTASIIPAPTGGDTYRNVANNSYNNLVAIEGTQRVSIFNGEISAVAFVSEGDPSVLQQDQETTFSVTFTAIGSTSTAGATTTVLSWGGHISRAFDWANFGGSATTISGSPYHTRVKTLEVGNGSGGFNAPISIGNQDRALASSAVQPPSGCTVNGDTTACNGSTKHYTLIGNTEAGVTYTWNLTDGTGNTSTISSQNTDPTANTPYGVGVIYADVSVSGSAGSSYTIKLIKSNAAGSTECPLTATILADTTSTSLSNQVVCPGGTATFSTTASGAGTFAFVWKNGSTVLSNGDRSGRVSISSSGATSTLTITSVDASDAANQNYSVDVTGTCNTVTKSATLTVKTNAALTDPADLTLCPGANATFSTTASGDPPAGGFVFTWKKGNTVLTNGGKYTITNGATTSSLTITGIDSTDAASYSVSSTGACNSTAQTASLTVKSAISITTPPSTASACQGSAGPVNFSVTASGAGTLHYQWKVDGVGVGQDSASLSYNPSSLSVGDHTVRVDVTDDCSSTFATTTLTINPNPSAGAVADAPAKCQVASGTSFSLDGTATNGTASWSVPNKDASITAVNFGNANAADTSVTLTGVGSATLRLTVTSTNCGSATADVTVTVNPNPSVTIAATDVCASSATLTATVSNGTGPFTYVWTKDGQPFATHSNVATATDSISVNTTGTYQVTVTDANSCSGARSGQVCFSFALGSASLVSPDRSTGPNYAVRSEPKASGVYTSLARMISLYAWKVI